MSLHDPFRRKVVAAIPLLSQPAEAVSSICIVDMIHSLQLITQA